MVAEHQPSQAIWEHEDGALFELAEYTDEIEQIASNRLLREARGLGVPVPHEEEAWWRSRWNGERALTAAASFQLRQMVRKERAERRAVYEWWIKLVSGLLTVGTGFAGAVIGVLAYLK